MNKKGFTLAELLAVIVILAVILVIAVPKITNVISDTKESTLLSSTKLIAKSAESKYATNKMLGNTDTITCDSVAKINTDDYQKCSIIFDGDIAKVSIIGKGKFAGLEVCDATKEEASIDTGHSACKLNSAYQEVEYIKSAGAQWIDTGFKPNQNTTVEIKFYAPTSGKGIFGARTSYQNEEYSLNTFSNRFVYGSSHKDGTFALGLHLFKLEKSKLFVDDILKYTFPTSTFQAPVNLCLFLVNSSDNDRNYSDGTLFYSKVYDNDVLVRDYIPVYRKSDNVIGLYDLVNDVFYENAGTGVFLKGNNIVR